MEGVELQPSTGKGLDLHVANFIDCIKDRSLTPNASIGTGAHVARVALLGNIAFKTGRRLYWDHEKKQFPGDAEANSHLTPEYRAPWKLPEV